jgi:hypothetical protein
LVTTALITAPAQYVPGIDQLLLGFTTPTSTGDLVVDLGTPASIGVGGSNTVDLIANGNVGTNAAAFKAKLVSLYGSVNSMSWGVVGGHQSGPTNAAIYSTVTNGAAPPSRLGDFGVAFYIDTAGFTIDGSFAPTNQAVVDPTLNNGNSWSEIISPGVSLYCFAQNYYDPDTKTRSSFGTGVNYAREDLYLSTRYSSGPVLQGTFTLGSDGSFTFTPASGVAAPSATTLAASAITAGTATLNATMNPNGAATTFSFQYGTNTAYGSATPVVMLPAGTTPVSTNATVTSLLAGKTYHFRVVATNSAGSASGSDMTFTTLSATPPQIGGVAYGSNGFQFAFTYASGGSFTAWGTTNVALPLTQWSNLGPVTVTAPGQYQFTDARATNGLERFYRVTQP